MAEERDAEGTEALIAELHKKIKDAFEVFDHESNNTVDVREIGTIIRSLGCCPTEGELHDFIAEIEEEEPTGYIRFEKFIPVMTRALVERRYRPAAEDILLRAFEVLDPAKRGFLTKDELVKYMTEEGSLPEHGAPNCAVGSETNPLCFPLSPGPWSSEGERRTNVPASGDGTHCPVHAT